MRLLTSRDLIHSEGKLLLTFRALFCWLLFFVGIFFTQKNSTVLLIIDTEIDTPPLTPKASIHLPVITTIKGMKEKKWTKTNIGEGCVVKEKVRYMEDNKREGRISRTSKEVVVSVQAVVDKMKFLV